MTLDVSSEFKSRLHGQFAEPYRKFLIGSSDYSEYVTKWPKFKDTWDEVRPAQVSIALANEDQTFNFFRTDRTHLRDGCDITVGLEETALLTTEDGELITTEDGRRIKVVTYNDEVSLFKGDLVKVAYVDGTMRITAHDKFKQLGDRVVGTSDVPIDYTTSNYLPSDLAWFICTSHGGLDATESTSNPDIDWAAFEDWAAIFSGDNVLMNAHYDGQNCNAALKKIARMTRSSMYVSNNKITFKRFTLADPIYSELDGDHVFSARVSIDDKAFTNKQFVFGDYSVESDYWTISTLTEDTVSVNSFGEREDIIKDEHLWYIDSSSCINLGERITTTENEPFDQIEIDTGLLSLPIELGDVVGFADDLINISDTFRVMSREFDLEKLRFKLSMNKTQVKDAFTLDVSTLDGSDVII